ncbi:MAG: capsule assembly Wzi family protein [Thalassotalea sp.]
MLFNSLLKNKFSLVIFYLCCIHPANANGVSPYLPLQTDPLIELELEKLATVAKMPVLSKPYHAATVLKYLNKISDSHPGLFHRINEYLKRYKKNRSVTHAAASLSLSSDTEKTLNNKRGQQLNSHYAFSVNSFWQANNHLIFNGGGRYYQGGEPILSNTFASFGWDVFQVDLGYREHWLSPHHESAILKSTQAETPFNITISNSALLTDWNIQYQMSVALLDKMDGIKYGDEYFSGKPGYLTMSMSIQPFEGFTLGGNRTFMFGGGQRSVGLSELWQAVIDPVGSDNCGGESTLQDCDKEVGNQQASIITKFDSQLFDIPFTLSLEYGGEDTGNFSNTSFSNQAYHYGLFFPYLPYNQSLYLEYTKYQTAWYVHGLYKEGYANNKHKMGHWWGDNKHPSDGQGGYAANIKYYIDFVNSGRLTLNYRTSKYDPSSFDDYKVIHEYQMTYSQVVNQHFIDYDLYLGNTAFDDSFTQATVTYRW